MTPLPRIMGLVLLLLAGRFAAAAALPSGADIARAANVAWTDAAWASDGTGALPIGNGDVAVPVWVDEETGDLQLLLRKSDVFDENSQPVTTGALRLRFDPPLWKPPLHNPLCDGATTPFSAFDNATHAGASTIGDQQAQLPQTKYVCRGNATCAEEMAAVCCATPGCVAYSLNPNGRSQESEVAGSPWSCKLFNCTCQGLSDYYGVIAGNGFGCTPPAAKAWWGVHSCGTKAKSKKNCDGPACSLPGAAKCTAGKEVTHFFIQMYNSTAVNPDTPGPGWTTFVSNRPHTPAPPPPPAFHIELDIPTSTVTVTAGDIEVKVRVELNSPLVSGKPSREAGIVHVEAMSGGKPFDLSVTLEPFRKEGVRTSLGAAFCEPRFEHADTVVTTKDHSLTWYHWNHLNTSYMNDTLRGQGIDPALPGLPMGIFDHRAWGAKVTAVGLKSVSPLVLKGSQLTKVDVVATLLTLAPADAPTDSAWLDAIETVQPAPTSSPASSCSDGRDCTTWGELLERSYIELTSANQSDAAAVASAKQITDHVVYDRYLSLIQGRAAFGIIKFNGQMFTANLTGKGWDSRSWGAGYWWQNERQYVYNVLAQGDIDTMRSFLDFYLRMLPFVNVRTKAQFRGTDAPELTGIAALFEETCTQFGTYMPSNGLGWGCGNSSYPSSKSSRPHGASANSFIRFHWTGALELSLLILDLYDWQSNLKDLQKYKVIPFGVVEAYRQRFPKKDTSGKTDMWPAQALETYQCSDPTSRANCPSNPSTDIAGLMAVLPRLIALPDSVASLAQKASWKAQLDLLPPLPLVNAAPGKKRYHVQKVVISTIYPQTLPVKSIPIHSACHTGSGVCVHTGNAGQAPIGSGNGFPTSGAGNRHNSENTEEYINFPFRLYGIGKPTELALAQQTYIERHSPCNDGWCQDLIQAAMLNFTDDAASMVAARAAATDHGGFRFEGFAGHYQDFEPSLDHYGFMRTGLNYMLMSTLDDDKGSVLLFPAFPAGKWNVRLKLHAPRNTTIEASCQGGKLEYLIVTPPERKADVTVMNCQQ